ncbi:MULTISPECIES: hypothetical protein [unclassified Sphingomonas]|uniref:hypothetical protein n=1 Tax=unclassified Sphingomonas TaxID=196159 RepID=UPI001D12A83F|nr:MULTISPECIES: hypothetical protein [unclassified Sphingomonas]MCC2979056.1 hypothetical protein [Sphingomonas sp. IC4-52]MCD2315710.1 hypothetical protein [Sphingomonas sp. IC-11]
MLFDHFAGAQSGWRIEAKIRARRVMGEQPDDPLGYVDRRLARTRFASFERRRWKHIRTLVLQLMAEEARRIRPTKSKRRVK